MNEQMFWEIIESAWQESPEFYEKRANALETNDDVLLEELIGATDGKVLENYKARLLTLDKEALTEFIHILEEKLFGIDREEIQEHTDGGDDGFLYSRCFIVALGEKYYKMIDENPSKASAYFSAEIFGFSAYDIYEEKYGEEFERNSIHCIESCSNEEGWKS